MGRKKVECPICGQMISLSNVSKHERRHKNHPETFRENVGKYKLNHDGLICQFCGRECKNRNSLCNHERLCKLNPDRQLIHHKPIKGFNKKGGTNWSKGLDKNDPRIQKRINTYKENENLGLHPNHSYAHTEETKKLISERMKEIYKNKSPDSLICGRSKKGWYKGFYCQSSWELAFVIYNLEHNIPFERNKQGFKYIYNNEEHTYFPDFYLINEDKYIEIKGYFDEKSKEKARQFQYTLEVMTKDEMKPILKYVKDKYGDDFIYLYDKVRITNTM